MSFARTHFRRFVPLLCKFTPYVSYRSLCFEYTVLCEGLFLLLIQSARFFTLCSQDLRLTAYERELIKVIHQEYEYERNNSALCPIFYKKKNPTTEKINTFARLHDDGTRSARCWLFDVRSLFATTVRTLWFIQKCIMFHNNYGYIAN